MRLNRFFFALFMSVIMLVSMPLAAQTDKELREQRSAAQKERQDAKRLRDQKNSDLTKEFREYARQMEQEYQQELRSLDVELELKMVSLQAEQQARAAEAEAVYQKQMGNIFNLQKHSDPQQQMEEMSKQAKVHADEVFRIKRESADLAHQEKMAVEQHKHARVKEMEDRILAQAATLKLTHSYPPILASPIGSELTRQEEQWNQREQRDVARLNERNVQLLAKYRYGERLRAWERENQHEDHRLAWDERAELHQLESRQNFLSLLMLQGASSEGYNQQTLNEQMAEFGKAQRLIKIKYEQIRKENSIKRREERKQITE